MLNVAGPQFDFGHVVYAVLQDFEHRRRGFANDEFSEAVETCAREKLTQIKEAYDEFGGSKSYWDALQKEVLETVVPQYSEPARAITALERSGWNVFRGGDIAARLSFALVGLVIGSIIIATPWIPIFEDMFAFALTVGGFFYPDIKRYYHERQFSKLLNRLVAEAARYQDSARLSYMTRRELEETFEPPRDSSVTNPQAQLHQ